MRTDPTAPELPLDLPGPAAVAAGSQPEGGAGLGTGIDLGGLLGVLGVSDTSRHDAVAVAATGVLAARGVHAFTVDSLLRNRLVLAADPQTVALLRYDQDAVLAALNAELAEPVRSLRFVVSRAGTPAGR